MKVVLDTNVLVSGVFFSGPAYEILNAWRHGKITLVVSPEILDEYKRVGDELAGNFAGVDIDPWLELLMVKAELIDASALPENVCSDPDDDKFLACALASRTKVISSGDKHLLNVSGFRGITVLKPADFIAKYLKSRGKNHLTG